ncbi:hypothetical protein VULLAG_LOCUS21649 [Vulpes lagopus]
MRGAETRESGPSSRALGRRLGGEAAGGAGEDSGQYTAECTMNSCILQNLHCQEEGLAQREENHPSFKSL